MSRAKAGLLRCAVIILAAMPIVLGIRADSSQVAELSPLQTVIRGQSQWLAGAPASLRVIVTNHETGRPVRGAVHLTLTPTDQQAIGPQRLYSGELKQGTMEATFQVPEMNPGTYELSVRVVSELGVDVVKRPITIAREARVLLTTDKPLYQPGQTMHLRALALRRPAMQPAAGDPLTFEVEDAKGNKVFKKTMEASEYGIASAKFVLADEVNMGRYTVRAITPDGRAERTVEVKRYVLPKFKVTVTTDRPYYLPGARLTGKVQCDYFFGKPVAGGEVRLKAGTFDVGFTRFAEVSGRTDAEGLFKFEVELPKRLAGQPLVKGKGLAALEVEVEDRARHTEKKTHTFTVSSESLEVDVIPEAGRLIAGVENRLFVLTSYPDGTSAPAEVTLEALLSAGRLRVGAVKTGAGGFATLSVKPGADWRSLFVSAVGERGDKVSRRLKIGVERAGGALLLRTDRPVYSTGQKMRVSVITAVPGPVFVDLIRQGQTLLTSVLEASPGENVLDVPLTVAHTGTLTVHAYRMLPSLDFVRDTRKVLVRRSDDLRIRIESDRKTYKPGAQTELTFTVTDGSGRGVPVALGLSIVDEAVFALGEAQPGLAKIYFALEEELMKPKYQIHGFSPVSYTHLTLPTN